MQFCKKEEQTSVILMVVTQEREPSRNRTADLPNAIGKRANHLL
jgi:hypothetical protein